MKLLFDQNLSFKLCQALADLFPGSSQARLLGDPVTPATILTGEGASRNTRACVCSPERNE